LVAKYVAGRYGTKAIVERHGKRRLVPLPEEDWMREGRIIQRRKTALIWESHGEGFAWRHCFDLILRSVGRRRIRLMGVEVARLLLEKRVAMRWRLDL